MLQGRYAAPSGLSSTHADDTAPPSSYPLSKPSSTTTTTSSLADSIRALRESSAPSNRPNILPHRTSDPRAGRRKPAPSPLGSTSESAVDIRPPQSPRSAALRTSPDEPRSPREKLEALLATEDSRPSYQLPPPPHPPSQQPQQPAPRPQRSNPSLTDSSAPSATKAPSYAQLRNASAPVVTSAGPSPPSSPTAMLPSSRQNQVEPRPTAQRNPSIDSAVSSISSNASQSYRSNASHSYKSSQDMSANPPDMAALIAAAGSAEAALLHIWKEKQSASAHNTQLWRLVEKQRTMILGLNKDLERALKDKERYRKKLKDQLAQVPPLPQKVDSVAERGESQSPALSDGQDTVRSNSALDSRDSPREAAHPAAERAEPEPEAASRSSPLQPSESASAAASPKDSASHEPSPVEPKTQVTSSPHGAPFPSSSSPAAQPQSYPSQSPASPKKSSAPLDDQVSPKSSIPNLARPVAAPAPSLSITQPTPVIGPGEFPAPAKSSQPLRKPPPAPLNLSQQLRISPHLHEAVAGENFDDSDYDDLLEANEIPSLERGRRKTREEDDRVREVLAQQELEERSRSKKKKSKSKSKTPSVADDANAMSPAQASSATMSSPMAAGLPASPRLAPAANSLNAILSPAQSDTSTNTQRSVISPPLLSPGLPMSPRPGDRPVNAPQPRMPKQTIASPPMSPRAVAASGFPLSPRAPKQPIPMPPSTPLSFASPHLARAEAYAQQQQQQQQDAQPQQPQPAQSAPQPDMLMPPPTLTVPAIPQGMISEPNSPQQIYRGLMSEQYPGLLLPPNALPSIQIKVFSSRLQPSRHSFMAPKPTEEDPVFILAIYARSDGKQLWRNEKTIHALPALDQQIRALCDFNGKLPDRSLFSGHAPAKIDARRAALNAYFDNLLDTPMNEMAALVICEFFSTDVIGAELQELKPVAEVVTGSEKQPAQKSKSRKEGYLTKRGKNFGGWKARYFVLEGPELRYYETVGGAHLGTIKLTNAQIGKQSQQQSNQSPSRADDADNQYRHAFLILEPKRKDSSSLVRHVLCAESDEERDAWVETLLQYVDVHEDHQNSPTESAGKSSSSRKEGAPRMKESRKEGSTRSKEDRKEYSGKAREDRREREPRTRANASELERQETPETLRGISYEQTVAAEAPVRGPALQSQGHHHSHSSPKAGSFGEQQQFERNAMFHPLISGPTNGSVIQDASTWGNKSLSAAAVKDRKRSIFAGFSRGRSSSDLAAPTQSGSPAPLQGSPERIPPNGNVFGIPLQEAVDYTQPYGVDNYLPAVVYRCLEYLQVKSAEKEEGIFRLSGSNIVIKALRERFNTEGDIRLLDGQYYDIHAVASLLKLYLRELPASVLTRELHLDFLKVLDLDERPKKIAAFNVLVHRLPRANFELLQALSSFLIDIINNANINKMTVRNVGIVFAPTLNIPAPLISMFLTDYADIFGAAPEEMQAPPREIVVSAPADQGPEIRSPRHQMFSDIPTPSYQQGFQEPQMQPPPPPPPPQGGNMRNTHVPYDTGFIPMQPSYEMPRASQAPGGYATLGNGGMHSGNMRDMKARRRESGMMVMNMNMNAGPGPRKGSYPQLRDQGNSRMVKEEDLY